MDAIGYYLRRVFGGVIERFFDRIRYTVSDAAEAKIRETVERPFQQAEANRQQQKANRQDPNS
jgi:hypothetical protein